MADARRGLVPEIVMSEVGLPVVVEVVVAAEMVVAARVSEMAVEVGGVGVAETVLVLVPLFPVVVVHP
jgi:hypothetical protein